LGLDKKSSCTAEPELFGWSDTMTSTHDKKQSTKFLISIGQGLGKEFDHVDLIGEELNPQ